MHISTFQKRVIELLTWFLKASQEDKDNYTEKDELQVLETLLFNKDKYRLARQEVRDQISNVCYSRINLTTYLMLWQQLILI